MKSKFLLCGFIVSLCLLTPQKVYSAVVRLGDSPSKIKQTKQFRTPSRKSELIEVACLENKDCSYDKECIALKCESVCKHALCDEGLYCGPAGQEKPHEYDCYECATHAHCEKGMYCDKDFTCQKPNPCRNAICSPAAPFCSPKPYDKLPYTCVQCLETEHCPPLGGLTRSCIDGFCLFNVEGNIVPQEGKEEE